MSNTLVDAQARKEALNVEQSYIVQAPAGSGKTELLTQRILALLAVVNKAPEQVLAITFTRKAAAEMRTRVLNALQKAANEAEPEVEHHQKTWRLARNVLERDKNEQWDLIEQPNRLRILTIDGLCSRIARQSPTLSGVGGNPVIIDDPSPLYRAAAQNLLLSVADDLAWASSLKSLLLHVDNHVGWLEVLFARMLSRRDQWMPYVVGHLPSDGDPGSSSFSHTLEETSGMTGVSRDPENILKTTLEAALQEIIKDALHHCANTLPHDLMTELIILSNFAARNLEVDIAFDSVPEPELDDLPLWEFMSKILLTTKGTWRKKMTKTTGFPAPSSQKEKVDKDYLTEMKNRMHALLETLNDYEPFRIALNELMYLPPTTYSDQQWEILSCLIDVLPVLVAYLQVEFQTNNAVDYIEVSSAALTALGSDDDPTDVALNWDYKIEHILVDEFQDTSLSQFRLVEKLTGGWEVNDGRTIFLVGDPMQSIYRFREAEVGLFLRARHYGIGNIDLRYLQLQTNFRSEVGIVDWVNQSFSEIFPKAEDMVLGAVPFHTASLPPERAEVSPDHDPGAEGVVHPHFFINASDDEEAQEIIKLIKQEQTTNPDQKIAILVRSRTHLDEIIPLLQSSGIRFQANEIEHLSHRMVIRDLLSLTKALWHLGDRLAWLSILRAPWCGLRLKDLHIIASDHEACIYDRLQNFKTLSGLSKDAIQRLELFLPIISFAVTQVRRISLRECVKETWTTLNGPACIDDKSDLENAERFFELIEKLEEGGDIKQLSELERRITSLYATPDPLADDRLQIMSIHKAKGLEFDTVIIPGMNKRSGVQQSHLMTWLERPRETRGSALILAPIKHAAEDYDSIYAYCNYVDSQKAELETVRLLYVAATRAKKTLHLFGCLETDEENLVVPPKTKSLLHYLWPVLPEDYMPYSVGSIAHEHVSIKNEPVRRLSLEKTNVPVFVAPLRPCTARFSKETLLPLSAQRVSGTLIHEILQKISIKGLSNYPLENIESQLPFWQARLLELGLSEEQSEAALKNVETAIKNTLNDERGRWILSNHEDAQSEYPLTTIIDGQITHMILDRTFVDENNIRWIIDYKTGEPNEDSHREQLKIYATAMEKREKRLIKCCLYYPLIPSEIIF